MPEKEQPAQTGTEEKPQVEQPKLTVEQQEYMQELAKLVNAEAFIMDFCYGAALKVVETRTPPSPQQFQQFQADLGGGQLPSIAGMLACKLYENVRKEVEDKKLAPPTGMEGREGASVEEAP